MTRPRFPYAPLARHLPADAPGAAQILGVTRTTIGRWRHHGIPADQADTVACAAGIHPANVWPDWWTATDTATERAVEHWIAS